MTAPGQTPAKPCFVFPRVRAGLHPVGASLLARVPMPSASRTRPSLALICVSSRRRIALGQRRGHPLHPPLACCEDRREPGGPQELVRTFPMAGGMQPDPVLIHRLWTHRHRQPLFAPSTDRVRNGGVVRHAPARLPPHRRAQTMRLTPRERTSPPGLTSAQGARHGREAGRHKDT